MKNQTFQIEIEAKRESVWAVLWNDKTYREWTSAFTEGSHAKSDWQEGSKIHFLDPKGSGMVAIIEKKEIPAKMFFKHIGIVEDGVEDTTSEKVKEWAPSEEKYYLSEEDGTTLLQVQMEMDDKHVETFKDLWSKALQKVKELSEN
ncbi:SRPBCC family protein [Luteirhabdus pelagi]|jgi:hypothetical protein|uniref:SRPBCC domain-containing protein n=1 Tax=Luteirhabdus pelagi TaxID=2792783 RepID=UPI0019398C7C|nr:SRPBCC domain-containing protein [Luteirhabdus pelagi]